MSKIITFYSYKGGVGRSMALVNVATLLSKWGKKVLMIDWDLEAPGLEYFFKQYLPDTVWAKQKGLLEYLFAKQNKEDAKWQDSVLSFKTEISTVPLNLLVSGKENGEYTNMLRAFNVSEFYEEHDGGRIIENFRDELLKNYDYILIDSRTGVTDFGGICTVQLPDILVMLFTPTEQGLQGTIKIAKRVAELHKQQPVDRYKLLICPVPSRIDATAEFKTTRNWFERISADLGFLYREWMPESLVGVEFLEKIKIPYFPHFSYGEKIPVIEQGTGDPAGLGYAYENLAMLLGRGLDEVDEFVEKREKYLEEISGEESIVEHPTTLTDLIRRVRIFISFTDEDSSLKDQLLSKVSIALSNKNVEFLYRKPPSLGQSRINILSDNIGRSDIVVLLITNNYFIPSSDVISGYLIASDVHEEFDLIKNIDDRKELIIPIYLNSDYNLIIHLNSLSARQGIVATDIYAYDPIEYSANQLLPVIEQEIRRKSKLNLVA